MQIKLALLAAAGGKLAMQTEAALEAGILHPFTCPIVDQDNATVACKDGNHLSDLQIRGMNVYVKGIDEKLPR